MADQKPAVTLERLQWIIENVKDIIYTADADGNITYISPQVSMLGVTPDEMVGASLLEHIHPGDLERVMFDFQETVRTGREFPTRFRALTPDGRVVHLEEYGRVTMVDGKVAQVTGVTRDITDRADAEQARLESEERFRAIFDRSRDITDRRRDEEALRASEERLRIVLDNSRDIIYAADARGRVTYVSPQISALGLKPEEVTGTDMFALIHPDDRPMMMATFLESLERELNRMNYFRLVGPGGRVIFVEESSRVRREGGRATVITGILRDISKRKQLEVERDEIFAELTRTLAEVKQLSGIIPICAGCKKIRDDKGCWKQVEIYIRERSDAEFSHGLCPDCMTRLYPEEDTPAK